MKKFLFFLTLFFVLITAAFAWDQINISFTQQQNTPYFIGNPEINIDAEEFTTVVVKIKAEKSTTARLFFASSYDPQMNEPKSIWFFLNKGTKEYVFNIKAQNPNWIGFIGQFLIYPENGPKGIEVKEAKVFPGNLITTVKSGWQEFWGPKGRLIEGPTVNNMRALMLWGKPVNFYAYSIILLITMATFLYFFYLTKNLALAWQICGRISVMTGFIFLAMLTASQLVSEYDQFKQDFNRYAFKTLEEKRAMAVSDFGKEFYPFLMFCKANLPDRAGVKLLCTDPTGDYMRGRANYFLYPINFFVKEPNFILAYNYEKGLAGALAENPNFRLYKKFKEGAFILWKK